MSTCAEHVHTDANMMKSREKVERLTMVLSKSPIIVITVFDTICVIAIFAPLFLSLSVSIQHCSLHKK